MVKENIGGEGVKKLFTDARIHSRSHKMHARPGDLSFYILISSGLQCVDVNEEDLNISDVPCMGTSY